MTGFFETSDPYMAPVMNGVAGVSDRVLGRADYYVERCLPILDAIDSRRSRTQHPVLALPGYLRISNKQPFADDEAIRAIPVSKALLVVFSTVRERFDGPDTLVMYWTRLGAALPERLNPQDIIAIGPATGTLNALPVTAIRVLYRKGRKTTEALFTLPTHTEDQFEAAVRERDVFLDEATAVLGLKTTSGATFNLDEAVGTAGPRPAPTPLPTPPPTTAPPAPGSPRPRSTGGVNKRWLLASVAAAAAVAVGAAVATSQSGGGYDAPQVGDCYGRIDDTTGAIDGPLDCADGDAQLYTVAVIPDVPRSLSGERTFCPGVMATTPVVWFDEDGQQALYDSPQPTGEEDPMGTLVCLNFNF